MRDTTYFPKTINGVSIATQAATVTVTTDGVTSAHAAVEEPMRFPVVAHFSLASVGHGVEPCTAGVDEEPLVVVAAILCVAAPHEVTARTAHGIAHRSRSNVCQCEK
ncbi:hypothetical protein [Heliothis virescens ascovirus 3e]|uniref:Uncharacterized protein n=1 Tax=Heliothis virescens ascovirus 3e TaxID=260797 RepID=A4KXK9_HVAVE|nr:hypothetical protein HVAV3e_gp153 [Heliothis virescens ascovirus 3e]ABO37340.1 hypothetical protein [Heliothis virescens ascovirus 3e]